MEVLAKKIEEVITGSGLLKANGGMPLMNSLEVVLQPGVLLEAHTYCSSNPSPLGNPQQMYNHCSTESSNFDKFGAHNFENDTN